MIINSLFRVPCWSIFFHDIISNLDRAISHGYKETDLIIMDLTKAFDKVPHKRH